MSSEIEPCLTQKSLKCAVCIDYFDQPHTLPCGHSFCIGCLRELAQVTRRTNHEIPHNRLKLVCPTCRKRVSARRILSGAVTVNYTLQDFVHNWLEEQSKSYRKAIRVRSVGSQSADEETDTETELDSDISKQEFGRVFPRRYVDISNSELDNIRTCVESRHSSQCNRPEETDNENSHSDSDSSYTSAADSLVQGPNGAPENNQVFGVLRNICDPSYQIRY